MACSKPVLQGQSPALCQFCEIDTNIKWKCIDCDLLLCSKCKDKIHSKVKTADEHKIINIKDNWKQSDQQNIRPVNASGVGTSPGQHTKHTADKGLVSLKLSIIQEYTTKFPVHYIETSLDNTLWIGSRDDKKETLFSFKSSRHLQKVKLERENLKIISGFNVDVRDIAVTPANDLILADWTPTLKQIVYNSTNVTESNYCVKPYDSQSVHVTRDNKVVVGTTGAVYVMDINGVHQQIYRHDNNNKPLFRWPYRITSTSTGTLCVSDDNKGRVVMLGKGEVISVYTGHPKINSDMKRFIPFGVVITSNDNIIVSDCFNDTLHILNNIGNFLTYYNTGEIGIENPLSLAFNTSGQFSILYMGCGSGDCKEGKLYKLTLSGC